MTGPVATMVAVTALALAWIVVAVTIAILAARRFRLAETVLSAARVNAALLESAPARPLVVRPDLRVEVDSQLLRDLGLKTVPPRLSDLTAADGGIAGEDLAALTAAIDGARVSARRVALTVRCPAARLRDGAARPNDPCRRLRDRWSYRRLRRSSGSASTARRCSRRGRCPDPGNPDTSGNC